MCYLDYCSSIFLLFENKLADLIKTAFTVLHSCSQFSSILILFEFLSFFVIIALSNGKSAALPPYAVFLSINQNISNDDSPNIVCLSFKHLQYDPKNPQWDDRDRLILSKGHAAPGLFSNMAVAGYFPESELETLRKFGSKLQGHPDLKCPGVDFCGGSLGTGLSYSVGVALAAKIDGKNHHIYTIMGDGESDEGQVWEAAMTAAKYKVDK